jgi:hypothetical protein
MRERKGRLGAAVKNKTKLKVKKKRRRIFLFFQRSAIASFASMDLLFNYFSEQRKSPQAHTGQTAY